MQTNKLEVVFTCRPLFAEGKAFTFLMIMDSGSGKSI